MMIYKASPGIVLTSICNEYFLVAPHFTVRVNETAAFYWNCLERGNTKDGLKKAALEEYEIENEADLEIEIDTFLDKLTKERLIRRIVTEDRDGSEI